VEGVDFFLQIHYEGGGGLEGGGGGRGLVFFVNFFFIIEWLGKGAMVFFFFDMLKGDGRGRGMIFLRVGLIHFILTKLN
jgi:hypothetical protein